MKTLLICLVLYMPVAVCRAQLPFEKEIQSFKQQDSVKFPKKGGILFVGSSSFRLWKTIKKDFAGFDVLNRGFGGAAFKDVLTYADDIILPYEPRQVVIYCGENDLASGIPPDSVFSNFQKLFSIIQGKNQNVSVVFVSIKPSPSRSHILNDVVTTNERIRAFLAKQKNTAYVDVFAKMLDEKGAPKETLFVEDRLHMNRLGYDIWTEAIRPYLKSATSK